MMTFNEKLVVLRKIKHLTQDEFASAVGVSRQAVYKWESGQSYPEAQKLIEMKLLFGISIDDLLDDTYEIELPKKKRRKRTPKVAVETTEAAAPVAPKAEPVAKVEAPVAAPKAEVKVAAPVVAEAPKAEVKEEAPVTAVKVEVKIETPAAPVAPETVVETLAEPVAEVEEEVVAEPKPKKEAPKVERVAIPTIEINDPTGKYAKRGGLFAKIFGNTTTNKK